MLSSFLLFQIMAADGCVTFRAYESHGYSLTISVAQFINERTQVDHASGFIGSHLKECTPGRYKYKVIVGLDERKGYVTVGRTPTLIVLHGEQPEVNPVTGERAHTDVAYDSPGSIRGTVRGAADSSHLWIRVQSTFDPIHHYDARVGADGRFEIAGTMPGHCVILVFRDGTPIFAQLVTILTRHQTLEIVLEPKAGTARER